ncbi:MAG: hypothetical protein CMK64_09220 [Pseudoalteromonas sp.]|nr:hypothetical protein [Pseudoalteromonas sp.]|tara:strand:- start:706 stop:1779 length:1074 start_codon:yes stop_codon:yes gene_type:complete
MKHFYAYRYQAFNLAIQEIFKQLQQFVLMLATLFYIFLPGLIAGLFFGLGKVVQSSSVQVSMQVALAYLIFQSLILAVFKPAILDSKNRIFHTTLLKHNAPQWACDFMAMLTCHVLWLLSLVLMLAMGPDKLSRAPHFVLFMFSQLSFAWVLLYRPSALFWAFISGFVLLAFSQSVIGFLVCLNAALLASYFMPQTIRFNFKPKINIWTIWLSYFSADLWRITWRITMSGLVFWAVFIIAIERPDLVHWYALGGALLNQLWWASLLIETNQFISKHKLYWQSINAYSKVAKVQWFYLALLASIFTLPFLSLFTGHFSIWLSFMLTPMVILLAKNRSQLLAVVWASCSILLILSMALI